MKGYFASRRYFQALPLSVAEDSDEDEGGALKKAMTSRITNDESNADYKEMKKLYKEQQKAEKEATKRIKEETKLIELLKLQLEEKQAKR